MREAGIEQERLGSKREIVHFWEGNLERIPCRGRRKKVICFVSVGAVAGNDRAAAAENVVSVKKGEAGETGVGDGLEKNGDGEPGELHF